tara:strand:- start:238 stop:498 length:261 start_codon:yes stop_codon:yes gene_type:complete
MKVLEFRKIIIEELKKFNDESTLGKLEIKEGFGGQLKGKDLKEFEKQRKKNAEVLGYKATGVSDIKETTLEVNPKEKGNKNEDNKD